MRSMVVYLTSHHLQAQSIMFIIANWPPDFSWLTVLIKKYVQIYQIGFSSFFFQHLTSTTPRQTVHSAGKSAFKFESNLLKTNEGIALRNRENSQTFVWWRAQTCPPPLPPQYKRLCFCATLTCVAGA